MHPSYIRVFMTFARNSLIRDPYISIESVPRVTTPALSKAIGSEWAGFFTRRARPTKT